MDTKKVIKVVFLIILMVALGITIYLIFKPAEKGYEFEEETPLVNPNKEAINANFVDIRYTRTTETDTEFITFGSDGTFSYSCACGNGVDNYDICEYYTYDSKESIKLVCSEENVVDKIKIVNATSDKLTLDFLGEIREFHKEVEEDEN